MEQKQRDEREALVTSSLILVHVDTIHTVLVVNSSDSLK